MKRIAVLLSLALVLSSCSAPTDYQNPEPTIKEVLFYGIFDNSEAYAGIIEDYERDNPGTKITYRKLAYNEYFEKLNELVDQGRPDIFILPYHEVEAWKGSLLEIDNVSPRRVRRDFVLAGAMACIDENKVWCLPANFDSLALFYNPNLVPEPVRTWEGIMVQAESIYKNSMKKVGGVAIGSFGNVTRADEILLLMLMQRGVSVLDEQGNLFTWGLGDNDIPSVAEEVRQIWRANTSWSDSRSYYAEAFAHGDLAMMIGYSWLRERILQENPEANFEITELPYFEGRIDNDFSLAAGWVYVVNLESDYAEEAKDFVEFLSQEDNSRKYAQVASVLSARKDLLEDIKDTSPYAVFARQAESAVGLPKNTNWKDLFMELREWVK